MDPELGPEEEQGAQPEKKPFSARVFGGIVSRLSAPADKKLMKRFRRAKHIPDSAEVERFHPALKEGLSAEEVALRNEQLLFNDVNKRYSKSYTAIFVGNICTFFNFLCLVVALALIYAGAPVTQFLFVAIFAINLVIGIAQELIAKHQIDKLAVLVSSTAKVMRSGVKQEIPIREIVLDDVILLEAGQQVPADCVLAEGVAEINESLLTGESVPVKKEVGEMLYAGSYVASGNCRVRAEKVGSATYLNTLTSKAKKYKKPHSEIMNSIRVFIYAIGVFIPFVAAAMYWVNFLSTESISESIMLTGAVVIGMIPSGLLLLTSLAMALGVGRLARRHTLVQDFYSLEMLARVNVLCLDKTGTITDGRMTVSDCMLLNPVSDRSVDEIMGSFLAALDENNQTAIALSERFGRTGPLTATEILPFSSQRKLSAVTFGEAGTFVLGAPEFVLRPLTGKVEKIVRQYAQSGLRVLVLAHSQAAISGERLPSLLRPVAIITLADNVRKDAAETIKWFRENDVNIKIISGDNPVTVSEVARRVGVKGAGKYISLDGLTDYEVENVATQYTVFGRVTPEQKAILVKALKKQGCTVAMTGDGVNDILALKEANCAITVATGAEAARNVSHIVLTDNNFMNLPSVVYEGRRVINNIKSCASLYITKTLFTIFLAALCFFLTLSGTYTPYFFKTNNMLLFEVLVAAIPSFVLSLQPNTARVKGKFIPYVLSRSIPGAVTLVGCIMAVYVASFTVPEVYGFTGETLSALYFLALTFGGLVILFRILQPFNLLRSAVYAFSAAVSIVILAVPFTANVVFTGWDAVSLTFPQILYLACVLLAAFPLSHALIKLCDLMNPTSEKGVP